MTDYSDLVERLRDVAWHKFHWPIIGEAADALEAQAKLIEELNAEVRCAYLECIDAVFYYDFDADLNETDTAGLACNLKSLLQGLRDKAIPNDRYNKIANNQDAWRRMLNTKEFYDD